MSDELIEKIQKLIELKKGDPGRLEHILNSIKQRKSLFSSDQKYLDNLIETHLSKESKVEVPLSSKEEKIETNQPEENLDKVQELQKMVEDLEEKVEKSDLKDSWKQQNYKSMGVTVLLSLVVGFFLLGIGHFYVGKKKNGIAWLVGGLVVSIPGVFFYFLTGGAFGAGVLVGIIYFILWIVQILSSASYCKQWNRAVSQGVVPW
ncbi:MAG: putative TM2 multi-domain protein [Marine Group I thaumarchaeote]|nr:MAG: putative TM2 multi-domain protein [Marine Group I thaumarchaeote]